MKYIVTTVLLFLLVEGNYIINPQPIHAQGTFVCVWSTSNTCSHAPAGYHDNCDPDYRAPLNAEEICNHWAFVPFSNATLLVQERQCGDHFMGGDCVLKTDTQGIGGDYLPPAQCPDPNQPISLCTVFSYPQNHSPGKCTQQGASCTDGIGDTRPWWCCAPEQLCASNGAAGIDSPLGCIPIDRPNSIVAFFLRLSLAISGGLALLLIFLGSMQILTSAGNPQRVQAGKELITAAATGLTMIIFSVFVLRTLGVQILQIPGL